MRRGPRHGSSKRRSTSAARRLGVASGLLVAAAVALSAAPMPAGWIENDYANGIYAALARTFVPLANAVPLTLGDILIITIGGVAIAYWASVFRPGGPPVGRLFRRVALTAAGAALIAIWFEAGWALNYRRVPIVARVAYDPARLNRAHVAAFSAALVAALNATAPRAQAERESDLDLRTHLAAAFGPVVRRLGDRYDVIVTRPKTTLFDWWFGMAGIGGSWVPFTYETVVNAQFLRFERPFAIAHEWGHDAGFGDESDANLIGALTTLRSDDPLIRYSGLFWAYGFLPEDQRRRLPVSRLVAADLEAARRRFLRAYNPRLFALQWALYDRYLRANRVTAGVASYSLFVQVLVGTPLDPNGLPLMRARWPGAD